MRNASGSAEGGLRPEPVPVKERAIALVSPALRRAAARGVLRSRLVTHRWRALPDTLIVGTMRGGTTSLFRWLAAHPDLRPSLRKETGYFTTQYHRGEAWYRAHFPLGRAGGSGGRVRRLEATPDYLLDPRAAERASALLPEARILALLRDPADRAFSHHRVLTRLGVETLPFEEAIEAEPERLASAWRILEADSEAPLPQDLIDWSYVTRGRYAEQLARWLDRFPREHVLALRSEDLYAQPEATYARVLAFLGLRPWRPSFTAYEWNRTASAGATRAPEESRRRLAPMFVDSIEELRAQLGWDPGWS